MLLSYLAQWSQWLPCHLKVVGSLPCKIYLRDKISSDIIFN
jgi:hypothetical protein